MRPWVLIIFSYATQYADLNNTTYPNLAKTVFVIFMIFVPILLLNMLIAMMGNTYAHVIEQSEKEWMKQWAKIVVTLERAVSQSDAQKYLEAYSIPLGAATDESGYETRGVMVIKSKSKSRANQRRGAVSNWKRVNRVTLAALKKRGLTGEQLRLIMWGRASICSPAKVSKKRAGVSGIGGIGGGLAGTDLYGLDGALNSALDVMSFAADIVMVPDVEPATATAGATDYKDPLRELVLISDTIANSDADPQMATALAKQATTLQHVREVQPPPPTGVALPPVRPVSTATTAAPPASAAAAPSDTATMFQDPRSMVDPVKEREFLRRLAAALDDSGNDDDDADQPVLGKISLLRRARSALSTRAANGEPASGADNGNARRANDRHPLFHVAWRDANAESGASGGGVINDSFVAVDVDGVAEQAENGDDSGVIPTAAEVRRHMEQFHMRRCQKPGMDARVMDGRTGKLVRNRRARTARNNK